MSNSKLILFYDNKYPANNKPEYYFNDIITKWGDYKIEILHDWIQWVFPLYEKSNYNPKAPVLTKNDCNKFKTSKFQQKIIQATIRILNFYGYKLGKDLMPERIKSLKRIQNNTYIGLYSEHNYKRITRILKFLNYVDMKPLSALFFLAMCNAVKSDVKIGKKVDKNNALQKWMKTQDFLKSYIISHPNYYVSNIKTNFEKGCEIKGLTWTGNSCYMDSVLLLLFAIPNAIINDSILYKNLDTFKNKRLDFKCKTSKNIYDDIQRRKDIQKELINITENMRKMDKNKAIKCSNLRSLLKKCPGQQEFHDTDMQDASEFLIYLFNMFQVDFAKETRNTYGTNSIRENPDWTITSKITEDVRIPIINVLLSQGVKEYNLQDYIIETDISILEGWKPGGVSYIMKKDEIIRESPYLVFYVHRSIHTEKQTKSESSKYDYTENILNTQIKTPESIISGKYKLFLFGIVIHKNQHYTCVIKCKENWFFYNDRKNNIKYIGNYNNMININPNPLTNGTLYFYSV